MQSHHHSLKIKMSFAQFSFWPQIEGLFFFNKKSPFSLYLSVFDVMLSNQPTVSGFRDTTQMQTEARNKEQWWFIDKQLIKWSVSGWVDSRRVGRCVQVPQCEGGMGGRRLTGGWDWGLRRTYRLADWAGNLVNRQADRESWESRDQGVRWVSEDRKIHLRITSQTDR